MTLTDRNLLNDWRDPAVLGAAIGANLFIMALMSVLFANVEVCCAYFYLSACLGSSNYRPTI